MPSKNSDKRCVVVDDATWEQAEATARKLSEREGRFVSISAVIRRGIKRMFHAVK